MSTPAIHKQWPFWLLTIAVFIGLPGITLVQDGMFMDAMLYTSVAHNEAQGFGSFWFPQFSKLNLDIPGIHSFHEQPPLVFGIESLFFRVFGSSMYVERLYVFVTSCITALLIHILWRRIFRKNDGIRPLSWIPVFLWITTPTVFWGASNNVNENTMGIFTLASVICSYNALEGYRGNWLRWLFSGFFIFLATLSKGFPGFFPLAVPFIYWLSTKRLSFKSAVGYSLILLLVPLGIYALLFLAPSSRESLSIYLFKRAFQRIASAPTTSNRFQSLESLLMDLLPQVGLLLIFLVAGKLKRVSFTWATDRKVIIFFVLTGLAGSAPLMLTMVQKAFYLLPCFPYFAIATAALIAPYIARFTTKEGPSSTGFNLFKGVSVLLLCGAITAVGVMKGKTGRDRDVLHDVHTVGKIIPRYATVTITRDAFAVDWELQCYLMRYYQISGDFKPVKPNTYLIIDKHEQPDRDLSAYTKMNIGLQRYDIYRLR